jgi:hypothetical protein
MAEAAEADGKKSAADRQTIGTAEAVFVEVVTTVDEVHQPLFVVSSLTIKCSRIPPPAPTLEMIWCYGAVNQLSFVCCAR